MHDLLDAHSLTKDDIDSLLADAAEIKASLMGRNIKKLPTLRGKTIITAFYENSTRTRVSFETAGKWLSADVINVSIATSSVGKGESLRDTALTLSAIGADAIVIRHPSSGAPAQIATWLHNGTDQPAVINAGDGTHEHPTQALLDALTLQESFKDISDKHIVIVGDILHSRVARSNISILQTLGAQITLVAPPTLLPLDVKRTWPTVTISDQLDPVLPIADAIMMLRVQKERMAGVFFPSPREYSIRYGLNENRQKMLPPHAMILHPGPMIRGLEVGYHVADSSQSHILTQVTNGVHIRMAVLYRSILGANGAEEKSQ